MIISSMSIKNFKSISSTTINFSPVTILVGPNAAGKSNLINVFRFISDIAKYGIDNAIALQGGIPYLANASLPKGTPISISFVLDLSDEGWIRTTRDRLLALEINKIQYEFIIQPNLKGGGYHVSYDKLDLSFQCLKVNPNAKREDKYSLTKTEYMLSMERKSTKSSIQVSHYFSNEDDINDEQREKIRKDVTTEVFVRICNEYNKELMLYRVSILLPSFFSENTFIRIFDFDPRELKKPSSMASTKVLQENGANLASILNSILRTKDKKKKLTTLLHEYLPFINGIAIENNYDKSYSYKIHEEYTNKSFHANFLSDGTVSLIAIIIALYFEELSNIIILEEPERNIHPKLLANLLDSADDVSREKQIIITTHNPEFLKHAKIDTIRLIRRDSSGFTLVSSPADNEAVKCFMKNDLGLDDLFLQDLLG